MLGLIATAQPLIHTLLGTKWLPIAPYMQILCIGYIFLGIAANYINILYVKGLSSTVLRFNIFYSALILLSIVFTMYNGIVAMLIAWNIVTVIYAILVMFYVGKKIQYTFIEQVKDILPYLVIGLFMGAGVFGISFLIKNSAVLLLTQLTVGVSFYLCTAYWLGSKVFRELIELVKVKIVSLPPFFK